MKKHNKYTIMGMKALQRAAFKIAEDAKKHQYKIPIWRNGRIEYEIPKIIPETMEDKNSSFEEIRDRDR